MTYWIVTINRIEKRFAYSECSALINEISDVKLISEMLEKITVERFIK